MRLFRPVGPKELARIVAGGMRGFPPRLLGQPIFYPVLGFTYAEAIARDWNSTRPENEFAGFVTAFDVNRVYVARFPVQNAGGTACQELWVPAEELDAFNRNIIGLIDVVAEYRGGERVD